MLNLLIKDFKLIFPTQKDLKKRVLSSIFYVLAFVCFVALETFLFYRILSEIKNYQNAPIAFMTLFLFVVSIGMIILGVFRAKKLLFNVDDLRQLTNRPIKNNQIILSKLLFLFLIQYVTSLCFTFPLFVSYGIVMNKMIYFYYLALFYPLLTFIYEAGIILLLVYPVKIFMDYLKKHLIIQFVFTILILFGFCFLYSQVLNVFIQIVAQNQLDSLLNVSSINHLIHLKKYFIPIHFLADVFVLSTSIELLYYLCIAVGILILGLTVGIASFNYFRNFHIQSHTLPKKEYQFKEKSVVQGLIKKEFILLFKDSNYLLSFTGLLIVQPFLVYLVIAAMNTIFQSGVFLYYTSMLPYFIPFLDILILMIFTLIIHQGANNYLSMEHQQIRIVKMIPVPFQLQITVKVAIPFFLSEISLFLTSLILWIGNVIHWQIFLFGFLFSTLILLVFTMLSLIEELKLKKDYKKSTILSNAFSYLIPLLYFIITIVLSYFRISIIWLYLIGLVLIGLCGLSCYLYLKKKMASLFLELEVTN